MPTYEYKCEKCGDRFEYFQSMTAPKLTTCEKCGGALHRLIGSGAGIIFKGKGFYCTDYNGKHHSAACEGRRFGGQGVLNGIGERH